MNENTAIPPDPTYCVACKKPIPSDAEFCPRCGHTQDRKKAEELAAAESARMTQETAQRAAQQQATRDARCIQQMQYNALRQAAAKKPGGLSTGFGIGIGIVLALILAPIVVMLLGGAMCVSIVAPK